MEHEFWHRRWHKNEIAFHQSDGNHLLKAYFAQWSPGNKVFVPLCGKTRDIAWLLNQGIEVLGCELNESAVEALFVELNIEPQIQRERNFSRYTSTKLEVIVGDFFTLTKTDIGAVSSTYDRAALVALPQALRDSYTLHLVEITQNAPQFLICYDYDQSLFAGPPFSVDEQEIARQYANQYKINQVMRGRVEGGFRGQTDVFESVYLLDSPSS